MEETFKVTNKITKIRYLLKEIGNKKEHFSSHCSPDISKFHQSFIKSPSTYVLSPRKQQLQHCLNKSLHLIKTKTKIETNIELYCSQNASASVSFYNRSALETVPTQERLIHTTYFTPKTQEYFLKKRKNLLLPLQKDKENKKYKQSLKGFHKNNNSSTVSFNMPFYKNQPESCNKKDLQQYQQSSNRFTRRANKLTSITNTTMTSQIHSKINYCSHSKEVSMSNIKIATPRKKRLNQVPCKTKLLKKKKSQLFTNSTKPNKLTVFNKYELQSYYRSLFHLSQNSPRKFYKGFETMLSLMNFTASQGTIKQWFNKFMENPSFQNFISSYNSLVESALKQSTVDYLQIIFQGRREAELKYCQIIKRLQDRMGKAGAQTIADQLYYLLRRQTCELVQIKQMIDICYKDEDFCALIKSKQQPKCSICEVQS